MSRRKEKKIKRLRRVSILPVIIRQTLTETAILLFSIFISALVILTIMHGGFIENRKDCMTIVQAINESSKDVNDPALHDRLKQLEKDLGHVESISLVDESEIKLMADGNTDYDQWINGRAENFLSGKKNFFYVPNFNANEKIDLGPSSTLDFAKFFKVLGVGILTAEDSLIWAEKERSRIEIDAFYRTEIPGVAVCINTPFIITNLHYHMVNFLGLLIVLEIIICLILNLISIMSLVGEKRRLTHLITTDSVTGGLNRYYFINRAPRLIKRQRKNYAVVQIRLEKYTNLCTAYGVKNGENILESIDQKLKHTLRKKEIATHLADADFALLLHYDDRDELYERVFKILEQISDSKSKLNFSAGICPVPDKKADISAVLNDAYLAMPKETKAQNEVAWFDQKMKETTVWERRLEDDMEKAVENHEFSVYLQPKYSAQKETLDAAEALVRWIHPELGFISPGSFIPLFEKNGFILKLDDYMLSEVCKLQSKWISEGKNVVPISVNVSRAHFATPDLAGHIKSIVDQWSVPYEYIELELTESAFFDDKATLLETVKHLKDFGFKLSMDDFGAGYSSLNSLKELPLDIIKLDAEFFRGVEDLSRSNLIVGDTIALAKKLGMRIVAEGIETREQVDFLAQKDCDLIQGFYFSKPLPVNEFEEKAFPEKKPDESE